MLRSQNKTTVRMWCNSFGGRGEEQSPEAVNQEFILDLKNSEYNPTCIFVT